MSLSKVRLAAATDSSGPPSELRSSHASSLVSVVSSENLVTSKGFGKRRQLVRQESTEQRRGGGERPSFSEEGTLAFEHSRLALMLQRDELSEPFGLHVQEPSNFVHCATEGSPAMRAGFQRFDRIVAVEGRALDGPLVSAGLANMLRCEVAIERPATIEHRKVEVRMFRESLAERRRTLGSTHELALQLMLTLAGLLVDASSFDEAESLYREALVAFRRKGAEDRRRLHEDHALALLSLATLMERRRREEETVPILKELLELRRSHLSPTHELTLEAVRSLARMLQHVGLGSEAILLCRVQLETERSELGPTHDTSLDTQRQLCALMEREGQEAAAEALYRDLLEIERMHLGREDPNTLRTMFCLASLLDETGGADEAVRILRDLVQIEKEVLGDGSEEVRASLATLGRVLQDADLGEGHADAHEVLAVYRELLELEKRDLGPSHPETRATMGMVSQVTPPPPQYGRPWRAWPPPPP